MTRRARPRSERERDRLERVALGVELRTQGPWPVAQVSTNVEDHRKVPLAALLAAVQRRAPVTAAAPVGLDPAAAFARWPPAGGVRNRRSIDDAV